MKVTGKTTGFWAGCSGILRGIKGEYDPSVVESMKHVYMPGCRQVNTNGGRESNWNWKSSGIAQTTNQ